MSGSSMLAEASVVTPSDTNGARQAGRGAHQHEVAVGEHREADAHAEAVDGGDERLGERLEHGHEGPVAGLLAGEDRRVGHLLQVLAGGERAALAGEHDAPDRRVVGGVEQGVTGGEPQRLVERVQRLGAGEGAAADAVGVLDVQHPTGVEGHARFSTLRQMRDAGHGA
ncbi:MAG: hypothetical protein QM757_14660 [Paludibaculum sp.]